MVNELHGTTGKILRVDLTNEKIGEENLSEETIKKISRRLGADHPSIKRIINLHTEIRRLCGET